MMKLGAFALNLGWVENLPSPAQTLKFARIFRSVISIAFGRPGPSITTLVVAPLARSLDCAAEKSMMTAIPRIVFIPRLQAPSSRPHSSAPSLTESTSRTEMDAANVDALRVHCVNPGAESSLTADGRSQRLQLCLSV